MLLILVARHAALFAGLAGRAGAPLLSTGVLDPLHFVMINGTTFIGAAFAAYLSKDGDNSLNLVIDLLMTNPFTGRRG